MELRLRKNEGSSEDEPFALSLLNIRGGKYVMCVSDGRDGATKNSEEDVLLRGQTTTGCGLSKTWVLRRYR